MNNAAMTYKEECEALRAEVERLNAVIESNIDEGINKIMHMSDEQISALAGFEGRSTEDQETIARQCFEIAERRVDHMKLVEENHELRQQLAASQLEVKLLREALEYKHDAVESLMSWCVNNVNKWDFPQYDNLRYANTKMAEALSSPTSTDALDAYVAEKVKETPLIEGGKFKTWREIALHVGAWKDHELGYIHFGSEMAVRAFVIHLLRHRDDYEAELTRQRDLAVSALEELTGVWYGKAVSDMALKALAAIKESEV